MTPTMSTPVDKKTRTGRALSANPSQPLNDSVTDQLAAIPDLSRNDLIERILVTSQLPLAKWHDVIGEPTFADAILDRIVHNAHRIDLVGPSMRKAIAPDVVILSQAPLPYGARRAIRGRGACRARGPWTGMGLVSIWTFSSWTPPRRATFVGPSASTRRTPLPAPDRLRIPMKAATDSDGKRPPVPIQNGHFGRGSNWAS